MEILPTEAKLKSIQSHMQNLGKEEPDFMRAFQSMMQDSKKPGALDSKTKELIGIALSVAKQCDRCIAWHVKSALDDGATRKEILEAVKVAIVMSGGPGLMHAQDVIRVLDDLGAE